MTSLCPYPYAHFPKRLKDRLTFYYLDEQGNPYPDSGHVKGFPLFLYGFFLAEPAHKAFATVYSVLQVMSGKSLGHTVLLPIRVAAAIIYLLLRLVLSIPLRSIVGAYNYTARLFDERVGFSKAQWNKDFWSFHYRIVEKSFIQLSSLRIYKANKSYWNFNPLEKVSVLRNVVFNNQKTLVDLSKINFSLDITFEPALFQSYQAPIPHPALMVFLRRAELAFGWQVTARGSKFGGKATSPESASIISTGLEKPVKDSVLLPLTVYPLSQLELVHKKSSVPFFQIYLDVQRTKIYYLIELLLDTKVECPTVPGKLLSVRGLTGAHAPEFYEILQKPWLSTQFLLDLDNSGLLNRKNIPMLRDILEREVLDSFIRNGILGQLGQEIYDDGPDLGDN